VSIPTHYLQGARGAEEIVRGIERAVAEHHLGPGDQLPTVRELAPRLGVSPSTVAAAYRSLATRGIVTGRGRQGTRVSAGPALPARTMPPTPPGVRNLAHGNPDPALLPPLRPALRTIRADHVSYGEAQADLPALLDLARERFEADGIPAGRLVVVSGALDGVERVLSAHLRPGDRVAVEDPGFPRVFDLVAALGLVAVPVVVDEHGMTPASLREALRDGATAVVVTPRAQNPTGAAFDERRARELRRTIRDHPDVLVVEDDHAGPIAGSPHHTLADDGRRRWAVVRSVAKSLGPDLRVALLAGDRATLDRVEGRLRIGAGWVSHVLQETVATLWSDDKTQGRIDRAAETYRGRRDALLGALADHGIAATAPSGLNVWVQVAEEEATIAGLLAKGWAVAGGERFRIRGGPALRITTSTLEPADARGLAADIDDELQPAVPPSTMA
jgi:DNA-binding transcriptional MocR family regulator